MKKIVIALALGMLLGSAVTAVAATNETVQAVFSKFAITVNGQPKELKTDPLVVDGTSYLPVREVANLVGYDVDYEDATRTIILSTAATGAPNMTSVDLKSIDMNEWISFGDLHRFYNAGTLSGTKDGKTFFKLRNVAVTFDGSFADAPSLSLLTGDDGIVLLSLDKQAYFRKTDVSSKMKLELPDNWITLQDLRLEYSISVSSSGSDMMLKSETASVSVDFSKVSSSPEMSPVNLDTPKGSLQIMNSGSVGTLFKVDDLIKLGLIAPAQ